MENELILQIARALQSVSGEDGQVSESCTGMKEQTIQLIAQLRSALYPHVFSDCRCVNGLTDISISYYLQNAAQTLTQMLLYALPEPDAAAEITADFMSALPKIKQVLETDIRAAYEGDPAAKNTTEIMLAYPAFEAISIFRLAHQLYMLQVPLIPRMMTEYAHQLTGIDIHPGATIGSFFFIDHGTGVVIGETTTIGDHVKLYQGVTLGAKSFETDENGNPVKGIKRHPDLGSYVVVYAGATILGGNTHIGDHCVIGGNVWLTHSVEAGKTVMAAQERPQQFG